MITKLLINSTLDTQWLNSDRSRGGTWGPPLFLNQTEARSAEKIFWRPPHLRVWMMPPPLILRSGFDTAEGIVINYIIPTITETPWRRPTLALLLLKFNLQYSKISFNRHFTKTYVCLCIILSVDSLKDEHIGLAGPKMSVLEGGDCLASFQMRKKIHIFVTRIKTYPSPSRVILVSLYKGTTRPIVALQRKQYKTQISCRI